VTSGVKLLWSFDTASAESGLSFQRFPGWSNVRFWEKQSFMKKAAMKAALSMVSIGLIDRGQQPC
jgi:hypothetical protein